MDTTTPLQLPALKKDAVVTIQLGTAIIGDLQAFHLHLIRDSAFLSTISDKLKAGTELLPDEQGIVTLSKLLQGIFQTAKDSNQIVYKDFTGTQPL